MITDYAWQGNWTYTYYLSYAGSLFGVAQGKWIIRLEEVEWLF